MFVENPEPPQLEEHPIRNFIACLIKDGRGGQEPAQLDEAALMKIRAEIHRHLGTPELQGCIHMVLAIASHLHTHYSSPRTAWRLATLTRSHAIAKSLRDTKRQKAANEAEELAELGTKFSGFTGEGPKQAPKADAKTPRNSIKIGSLSFPKRL